MSQDNKEHGKEGGGLLGHLFGRGGHEAQVAEKPESAAHAHPSIKTTLDLADIQGFILRGYRMPMVRHFLLTVGIAAEARKLLGRLISGDETDAPQRKPDYCLNVGITWPGLMALEVPNHVPAISFRSFDAFIAGAAARAD